MTLHEPSVRKFHFLVHILMNLHSALKKERALCKEQRASKAQTSVAGRRVVLPRKNCNCFCIFPVIFIIVIKMSGSETEESDTEMSVDSNANMPADDEDAMSVDENFDVDNAGVTRSQIESRLAAIQSREIQEVNVTGEPGHIQQIVLENFMCHENFKVDLGPRINFIIGPNGSTCPDFYLC